MKIQTSYAICAVQRSGSFLLCEALKNTGLAGKPEEYFLCHPDQARQFGTKTRREYLDLVLQKGTTANTVSDANLTWSCFSQVIDGLRELPEYRGFRAAGLLDALRILDFLGVAYPEDLLFAQMRMNKQANSLNDEWVQQYRAISREGGAGEAGADGYSGDQRLA